MDSDPAASGPRDGLGDMTARIYTRVSTLEQAEHGFSLAAQESRARAWCTLHGLQNVVLYPEAGVSGKRDSRPQLDALMADLQAGDTVIIYALSRLGRGGVLQTLGAIKKIEERGARIVSLTDQIDTDSITGRLNLNIMASVAQMEVELIRERTETGRLQAAAQGVYPHSAESLALGWTLGPGGRIVEDHHADTVRLIFSRTTSTYGATAAYLNDLNIPAGRGGRWEVGQVRRVVQYEPYSTGFLPYRRTVRPDEPGAWIDIPAPQLVTPEVWQAAQRDGRANHNHKRPDKFPLTGHLLCACGSRLMGRTGHRPSTPGTHQPKDAYVCYARVRKTALCPSNGKATRVWYDAPKLHQESRQALVRALLDPQDPAQLRGLSLEAGAPDPHAEERADIERRLSALVDLHLDGLIDRQDYVVRQAALIARRRSLSTPEPLPVTAERDLSRFAMQVIAGSEAELAELLDLLGVTFSMRQDGEIEVMRIVGLRQS
jgi:site-specific DNA recombinase